MHELALTQNILEIALRHASENEGTQITKLHLVIGDLSSVIDDSVEFYWGFISQDTIADGSKLCFKRIPATLRCKDCSLEFLMSEQHFSCPKCEGVNVFVTKGKEFYLDSIDIETLESSVHERAPERSGSREGL